MSSFILTDDKFIYETYGKALRKARKDYGLKQGVLAEKLNVNQSEVSRWENKGVEPLNHTKEKIEQVLSVNIAPVKGGWAINHSQDTPLSAREPDGPLFRIIDVDKDEELELDDLPQLIRLRDRIQEKIDKLVKKK